MSVRTRTDAEIEISIAAREAVVDALVEAGLADDGASLRLLLQVINDNLPHQLMIHNHAVGRDHLIETVGACARQAGGMNALLRAVRALRPGSVYERIRQLVQEPQVRDLLPAPELELLRKLLAETTISQLPTLVRRAAGLAKMPAPSGGNVGKAIAYLADLNAGPDGLPPLMLFVEHAARQIGGSVAANLMEWNDGQALRLGLEPMLRAQRAKVARVPDDTRLHLLIAVQHHGIDPDRCLLSYWRQDDPEEWPPPLGDTLTVMIRELEWRVDELVVNAERAWSGHTGTVALEIMLPRALLTLPVHRWHKEHDTGDPRPLCLDYPIVIRSLERMRSTHWHRVWRQRWRTLINDPLSARIHFGSVDTGERYSIDAILSEPLWVMMVLAAAPTVEPQLGSDELTAALRSGLPALMWHPLSSSDNLRGIVGQLAGGGLVDVPGRVQDLRRSAFNERSVDMDIAQDLVLLWDDPHRLVVLDQSPGPPLRGDIADEREQAS